LSHDLGGRIAVLSAHLDDAVFSLGATIARAVSSGAEVRIVTVFANHPESDQPASPWDLACGFGSTRDAARARRDEDARACSLVGATPVWLPFRDDDHGRGDEDDEVWGAVAAQAGWADTVLVPGFPLFHPDHVWLTRTAVVRRVAPARLGFYVEQPYASWRLIGRGRRTWTMPGLTPARGVRNLAAILLRTGRGRELQQPVLSDEVASTLSAEPTWTALGASPRAWMAKQRAVQAYASQLRAFGPLVGSRVALYELAWGGEGVAMAA
jgi:LmbE family N-acetylglucosaminyl deacetylase